MLKNILLSFSIVLIMLIFMEIYFQFTTNYTIDYYAAPRTNLAGDKHIHPYGEIPINSLGYPDDEFDVTSEKVRVGYIGDSVNYGLGAGYPYRISEYMERLRPDLLHWNIGRGVGAYLSKRDLNRAERLGIDKLIYILNLNDIAPIGADEETVGSKRPLHLAKRIASYFDFLRDKSYLYNRVRYALKNLATRLGYESSGYRAIELFPTRSRVKFMAAGRRVAQFAMTLGSKNVEMCILIVPYEMQISADAARRYAELGITWEEGFLNGSTQDIIKETIKDGIPILDPRDAFPEAPVGRYFVYNKGDRIDFNHPNRQGHHVLAKAMHEANFCGLGGNTGAVSGP